MAVRYSALGGKQTFMNDYERADQDALMRNAALQAAADQFSAQMGQQSRLQDDRQQAAFEELDRRNQFTLDRDILRPDYNQYYQQGGQQVAGLSNEQRLALMPLEQQIRESQLNRGVKTEGIRDEAFNALVPDGAVNPLISAYQTAVRDDPRLAIAALEGILGSGNVSGILAQDATQEREQERFQLERQDAAKERQRQVLMAQAQAAFEVGDIATGNRMMAAAAALDQADLGDIQPAEIDLPTPQGAPARQMARDTVTEFVSDPAIQREIEGAVIALASGDPAEFDRITDQVVTEAALKNIPEEAVMSQIKAQVAATPGLIDKATGEAAGDVLPGPDWLYWGIPGGAGLVPNARFFGERAARGRIQEAGLD